MKMVVLALPKDIKEVVFSDCIYVNELYFKEKQEEGVEDNCQDISRKEEKVSGCL